MEACAEGPRLNSLHLATEFSSVVTAAPPPQREGYDGLWCATAFQEVSSEGDNPRRRFGTDGDSSAVHQHVDESQSQRTTLRSHSRSSKHTQRTTQHSARTTLRHSQHSSRTTHRSLRTQSSRATSQSARSFDLVSEVVDKSLTKYPFGSRKRESCVVKISRYVVESYVFVAITILFTVYALVGDDIRLLCSEAPSDIAFDIATLICISIFTLEILLSTLGKDDYFLSFFFLLDVTSTSTLILDLSQVAEWLSSDEEDLDNVRGSRTARIGAKAARIVRAVRLVRIVKLYKAALTVRRARRRRKDRAEPGIDDDWLIELGDGSGKIEQRESRVSKKLSELTTRRVICLVLILLLGLPHLTVDESQQFPSSAYYGADIVREAFIEVLANITGPVYRMTYERALLQYVYYHNWYAKTSDCPFDRACPRDYDSHLFWVGIAGRDLAKVAATAQLAQVRDSTVAAWDGEVSQVLFSSSSAWTYNYGTMPSQVQSTIGATWGARCDSSSGKHHRMGFSLLGQHIQDQVHYVARCPEDLRRSERQMYTPRLNVTTQAHEDWHFVFFFDVRPSVQKESIFAITVTIFLCFALTFASMLFASDANHLVLYPVETMIAKLETIRENPLMAMKVADEEFKREEIDRVKSQHRSKAKAICDMLMCTARETEGELMETVILEKTITKLGSLLALGFGEAGAKIIEHNMHLVSSASVDAMVEGTRVECVIGATRIKDFCTATEVLQAQVMRFVNQIAEIVHGVVDEFHGAANRNNGDTFLIIWRTSDIEEDKVAKVADMAMVAFTKILGAVHRSPVLASYRGHPGLQQRLGRNCRVNLTSGLHYGWAIEGAVGSEFKIDASYLSPNVSVAESLERATSIYGVSILVAESVVEICSPEMASRCRLIDRVILPGSALPMELYVIDVDQSSLTVDRPARLHINWTSRQRYRVRQFLEAEKSIKWHDEVQMVTHFKDNPDILQMRALYTLEFMHVFNMGYQNYSQGEWEVAQRLLARTRSLLGVEDGPSDALLRYMESPYGFQAPENWQGIRLLDDSTFLA